VSLHTIRPHPPTDVVISSSLRRFGAQLLAAGLGCAGLFTELPRSAQAGSLFEAGTLDPAQFVLVSAPIGSSGERSQLNIYEQFPGRRACYSVGSGRPAPVQPLLLTFDFTGHCSRYIDANGFSVRVGESDLATSYRLTVVRRGGEHVLLAAPTRSGAGPEMVVARSGGQSAGYLRLGLEPGWSLMRRRFRGRNLGHVYLYTAAFPGTAGTASPGTAVTPMPLPTTAKPAAPAVLPAPPAAPAPRR
jgi:hypothetical protein